MLYFISYFIYANSAMDATKEYQWQLCFCFVTSIIYCDAYLMCTNDVILSVTLVILVWTDILLYDAGYVIQLRFK